MKSTPPPRKANGKVVVKRKIEPSPEPEVKGQEGDLRVWWIPQVPMNPFKVPVRDLREAKVILRVLAEYDIFQFQNKVKPDYCNAGGLEVFEDGEWLEWDSPEGESIDDLAEGDLA